MTMMRRAAMIGGSVLVLGLGHVMAGQAVAQPSAACPTGTTVYRTATQVQCSVPAGAHLVTMKLIGAGGGGGGGAGGTYGPVDGAAGGSGGAGASIRDRKSVV